jgi:hypothetical protein
VIEPLNMALSRDKLSFEHNILSAHRRSGKAGRVRPRGTRAGASYVDAPARLKRFSPQLHGPMAA